VRWRDEDGVDHPVVTLDTALWTAEDEQVPAEHGDAVLVDVILHPTGERLARSVGFDTDTRVDQFGACAASATISHGRRWAYMVTRREHSRFLYKNETVILWYIYKLRQS
jgi:hypothetical protein